MAVYKPIRRLDDLLPTVAPIVEVDTFDAKIDYPDKDKQHFEVAKDVAAFANHLGGSIVIGLNEQTAKVVPLTLDQARKLISTFEEQVRQRCSPRPTIEPVLLPVEGGHVVIINVEPFIGQPVGVLVRKSETTMGLEDVYQFPVRRGSRTTSLTPEVLPMYMLPEIRRWAILLSAAQGAECEVNFNNGLTNNDVVKGNVDGVFPEDNAFGFLVTKGARSGDKTGRILVPFDSIQCIWRRSSDWKIEVAGILADGPSFVALFTRNLLRPTTSAFLQGDPDPADLPEPESAFPESDVFDAKAEYLSKQPFVVARDVAAMAKRLGGTILVGLSEDRKAYVPMDRGVAEKTADKVLTAVVARCSPKPVVGRTLIPKDGKWLLAINVEPLMGLVGVKVMKKDRPEATRAEKDVPLFAFPVRTDSECDYVTAENLPMYILPELRQKIVLIKRRSMHRGSRCSRSRA